MATITIEMTEHDFERLSEMSFRWVGGNHSEHASYYENFTNRAYERGDKEPSWEWAWAYSVGPSWTSVMMARAYLKGIGEDCEVVWDMTQEDDLRYLILCNVIPRGYRDDEKEGPTSDRKIEFMIEERTRLGRLEIAAEEAEKFTEIFGEDEPVKALKKHLGTLILATQESLERIRKSDG